MGMVKSEVNPPMPATPYLCRKFCNTRHMRHTTGGKRPAWNTKCDFCKGMGHFKVTCKAFKRSQNKEVSKGDTKNKAGGEAAELMGIWDSNFTEPAGVRGISTPDYLSGE